MPRSVSPKSRSAAHLGVPVQRINELIRGKRGVTPETAWLLSEALNTTPEFWVNLQTAYDLGTQSALGTSGAASRNRLTTRASNKRIQQNAAR